MLSVAAAAAPMTPPSWGTVLTTWHPTWPVDVVVAVLAVWYLRAAWRVGGWPVARTVAALGALAAVVVTVDSGISAFAGHGFAVHMVMHLMLIMVVPVLWVAGRPLELCHRGASASGAARLDRVLGGGVARAVTFPVTVLVVYTLAVGLTHLTGFPGAMTDSPVLRGVEQLVYVVAGVLFFHTALGVDRHPFRPAYATRFVLMLVSTGVDTLVGIVLMMAPASLMPMHSLDDLHLGGAIMWAIGDGLMMVIMVVLAWYWVTDPSATVDFGPWLESARRATFAAQVGDDDGRDARDGPRDVDDDEALAAYNRMLARLHRDEHPRR